MPQHLQNIELLKSKKKKTLFGLIHTYIPYTKTGRFVLLNTNRADAQCSFRS
ncbi:hypothetical protein [Fulvivirga sp. M361]|uniref:hypothetical protein n=1 Tax=Fulvivirga sp. M361 TaxID=2594266 RepID=UPI001627229A|nr:hypothetical protein [Fulvivirga sp. M361]